MNIQEQIERYLAEELPGVELVIDHMSKNRFLIRDGKTDDGELVREQIRIGSELWLRLNSLDNQIAGQAGADLLNLCPQNWRKNKEVLYVKQQIHPGMKFLNDHGDLCEFTEPSGSSMWQGRWLTAEHNPSPSDIYEVGGTWSENETFFWEQVKAGKKKIVSDKVADSILRTVPRDNPAQESETIII